MSTNRFEIWANGKVIFVAGVHESVEAGSGIKRDSMTMKPVGTESWTASEAQEFSANDLSEKLEEAILRGDKKVTYNDTEYLIVKGGMD